MAERGGRYPGVDILRGVAALAVFLCHVSAFVVVNPLLRSPLHQMVEMGAHGVDLFIVISGFCLALPALRNGAQVQNVTFWKRRAARLLPPYWVALTGAFLLAVIPATYPYVVGQQASLGDFSLYASTLQILVPSAEGTINGSLWSISLEAHLYLCFPVLLLLWRRIGPVALLVMAASMALLWSSTGSGSIPLLGSPHVLPARLVQFVVGMWCADLIGRGIRPRRSILWAVLLVGLIVAGAASSADLSPAIVLWSVPCAAALFLVTATPTSRAMRALGALGGVSFSFYLVHQPILLLLANPLRRVTTDPIPLFVLGSVIGFVVVLAVAVPFFIGVERPSHRFSRNLARSATQRG